METSPRHFCGSQFHRKEELNVQFGHWFCFTQRQQHVNCQCTHQAEHYGHLPVKAAWTRRTWSPAVVSGTEISAAHPLDHVSGGGWASLDQTCPAHPQMLSWDLGNLETRSPLQVWCRAAWFLLPLCGGLVLLLPCPLSVLLVVDMGSAWAPSVASGCASPISKEYSDTFMSEPELAPFRLDRGIGPSGHQSAHLKTLNSLQEQFWSCFINV